MSDFSDNIRLVLPFKAEYVSIARLTASGVANRVGFDIETIEDIKVAVAEVCNKLVNEGYRSEGNYIITFNILPGKVVISFNSSDEAVKLVFNNEEDELGISIINAFMDDVKLYPGTGCILTMTKAIDEGAFADGK
ncbi:MAG: anti-sigma regulatory factor [Ruminiclostridium sp.]|nr:anti-sigma regulatory factor [Ruminiclostridium sp.]